METRLIMLPQPILVSDEEKFLLDRVWSYELQTDLTVNKLHTPDGLKIIAGIEGLPKLDLSLIAEGIGWVDVRLAAQKYRDEKYEQIAIGKNKPQAITASLHAEQGWFDGFNTSQSLNEKKYSEEDMRNLWDYYNERGLSFLDDEEPQLGTFEEYIQSISKPKEYLVEVEIEFLYKCKECSYVHEKLSDVSMADNGFDYTYNCKNCKEILESNGNTYCDFIQRIKIANNTIKVNKIL